MRERQTDANIRATTVHQKNLAFESENPWKYYPEIHLPLSLNSLIFPLVRNRSFAYRQV